MGNELIGKVVKEDSASLESITGYEDSGRGYSHDELMEIAGLYVQAKFRKGERRELEILTKDFPKVVEEEKPEYSLGEVVNSIRQSDSEEFDGRCLEEALGNYDEIERERFEVERRIVEDDLDISEVYAEFFSVLRKFSFGFGRYFFMGAVVPYTLVSIPRHNKHNRKEKIFDRGSVDNFPKIFGYVTGLFFSSAGLIFSTMVSPGLLMTAGITNGLSACQEYVRHKYIQSKYRDVHGRIEKERELKKKKKL